MKNYRAALGPVIVIALFVVGMKWSPFEPHRPPAEDAPAPPTIPLSGHVERSSPAWSDADWDVFRGKVEWSLENGLDTLPTGEAMARLGRTFVGTAYVPGTLEVDGPERVVVNFQGLDCVTFVENVFAITRFVQAGGGASELLSERTVAEQTYEGLLAEIRYRGGEVGYPTRLHYFSDWVRDHDERGLVEDLTESLGGELDIEPIDFMTTHRDAYRQLADPAFLASIRAREEALSAEGRHYLPQDRIASVADRIQNGDILAATSTVEGLDVAHTGLALWVEGELRLLHAPLVGEAVQISEVPLASRIQRIGGQDGVIVARPTRVR